MIDFFVFSKAKVSKPVRREGDISRNLLGINTEKKEAH